MDAVARATHLSSSSPRPPVAPRVRVPLIAPLAHVFVVRLAAAHAAPLLRAAPALRGLHRRPQTAYFGRGSTAATAAAVTGHAAAAGTVVLCVSMWNRTRSFLYAQGSCDCNRPATPCARSVAPCSGSHPFCRDPQPVVDRTRPELKGGGGRVPPHRGAARGEASLGPGARLGRPAAPSQNRFFTAER